MKSGKCGGERYLLKSPVMKMKASAFCLEMRGHQADDVTRYTGLAGQRDDSDSNHAGKLSWQIIRAKSE